MTYTLLEEELHDKLQSLVNQLSLKGDDILGLETQNENIKAQLEKIEQEKDELGGMVKFMQSQGFNSDQKMSTELQLKQNELAIQNDHLKEKYQRKKKQAKERKHALKAEIVSLKQQLLQKSNVQHA